MKRIQIEVMLTIGFAGADHEDTIEVEVDDGATPEEEEQALNDATREWAFNYIEWNYKRID